MVFCPYDDKVMDLNPLLFSDQYNKCVKLNKISGTIFTLVVCQLLLVKFYVLHTVHLLKFYILKNQQNSPN